MAAKKETPVPEILLKGGLLVDGTGEPGRPAHLLLRGGTIARISEKPLRTRGLAIDCTGLVVAPGFIDGYSHLDAIALPRTREELKQPMAAQGITSVVAGACGLSAAGTREKTAFGAELEAASCHGLPAPQWQTVAELFDRLDSSGTCANLALLAGHGSARASIRGLSPSPLHPYESRELFALLESAMEQGARGVSLGLQQVPGAWASPEELREVALLVRRRAGVLAVNLRAFSSAAPGPAPGGRREARNVAALREALELARRTGVRLQVSPLGFAGSGAWRTAESCLQMIDRALADGVDVRFSLVPRTSVEIPVALFLPAWFLRALPGAWGDTRSLARLARELRGLERAAGIGPADVRLARAADQSLSPYEGATLGEIARQLRLRPAAALVEVGRRSAGSARLLLSRFSTAGIIETAARHPACIFCAGSPAPGSAAAFPRLLALARDRGLMSVEQAVRLMSGAVAERFSLAGRGFLREKAAADIVVFDPAKVADAATAEKPAAPPAGIAYVFVNGRKIMSGGKRESPLTAGVPIR